MANSDLVQPFIGSVSNVLSTMAGLECEPKASTLAEKGSSKTAVAGVIGIAGNKMRGSLAITFSRSCFLAIVSEMLGEAMDVIDDDAADMASEIANMTMGGAKVSLAEKGYEFELAVPTAIWGDEVVVKHNAETAVDRVHFTTPHGPFELELCVIVE